MAESEHFWFSDWCYWFKTNASFYSFCFLSTRMPSTRENFHLNASNSHRENDVPRKLKQRLIKITFMLRVSSKAVEDYSRNKTKFHLIINK